MSESLRKALGDKRGEQLVTAKAGEVADLCRRHEDATVKMPDPDCLDEEIDVPDGVVAALSKGSARLPKDTAVQVRAADLSYLLSLGDGPVRVAEGPDHRDDPGPSGVTGVTGVTEAG